MRGLMQSLMDDISDAQQAVRPLLDPSLDWLFEQRWMAWFERAATVCASGFSRLPLGARAILALPLIVEWFFANLFWVVLVAIFRRRQPAGLTGAFRVRRNPLRLAQQMEKILLEET